MSNNDTHSHYYYLTQGLENYLCLTLPAFLEKLGLGLRDRSKKHDFLLYGDDLTHART